MFPHPNLVHVERASYVDLSVKYRIHIRFAPCELNSILHIVQCTWIKREKAPKAANSHPANRAS